MKIARLTLSMLLLVVTILNSAMVVYGVQIQDDENKVVMIVINPADLDDLKGVEEVNKLMEAGAIGLMNTRASGKYSEYKSYATIGWGRRAEASQESQAFFNIDEEKMKLYQRRTGELPPETGIINVNINLLLQQNMRGDFGAVPGSLGETLRQNGLKTATIGNANTNDSRKPTVGLIAMDKKGFIDYGDVSDGLMMENHEKPFGLQTNYDLLYEEFLEVYPKADFIVIETGDLSRLESYNSHLNHKTYEAIRKAILADINEFVKNVVDYIESDDSNTLLMLVVPYPKEAALQSGNRLTPVVFYGNDIQKGLLVSDTTRRSGIVANIDIAPTVLNHFGLVSDEMTGKHISTVAADNNLDYLNNLNSRVLNTSQQRYRVLYTFAIFEMIASVLALLGIIFKKKIPSKWRSSISTLLIATIIAPFTLLVLPIIGTTTITMTYLLLILITTFIVMILKLLTGDDAVLMLIAATGLLVMALMVDIVAGQNLIKNSILGYDPIIGARYYGIGNEFTGVLIGSTLVFTTGIIQKNRKFKWAVPFFYLLIILIIGFPKWGANVGGTITALFAFMFVFFRMLGRKMNLKNWIAICSVVFLGVVTFAIFDLFILENKSHLAGALQQIYQGGPSEMLQIITRKISMNIRVMGVTVWSRVLLMAVVVLGILFYKPIGVLKKIANDYCQMTIGWTGIIVAAAVGFLVNDSGVVMAAMVTIFLTTSILYLVLEGDFEINGKYM